jgi:hypothetical protein
VRRNIESDRDDGATARRTQSAVSHRSDQIGS